MDFWSALFLNKDTSEDVSAGANTSATDSSVDATLALGQARCRQAAVGWLETLPLQPTESLQSPVAAAGHAAAFQTPQRGLWDGEAGCGLWDGEAATSQRALSRDGPSLIALPREGASVVALPTASRELFAAYRSPDAISAVRVAEAGGAELPPARRPSASQFRAMPLLHSSFWLCPSCQRSVPTSLAQCDGCHIDRNDLAHGLDGTTLSAITKQAYRTSYGRGIQALADRAPAHVSGTAVAIGAPGYAASVQTQVHDGRANRRPCRVCSAQ